MASQESEKQKHSSTGYHPVTHVVFDCDGLLVDSEIYYYEALAIVAKRYNTEFTYKIKSEMMGTKPIEGAVLCLDRLGLTGTVKPEDFVAEYESAMKEMCPKIRLLPGAERLIKHLHKHNIPMAIATGASNAGFERKTAHIGDILRSPFKHHVFAGSDPDVKRGKPNPDVFEIAARRFNPPPKDTRNVLVFEDAINGVKAGTAANMQVVFVPDKKWNPDTSMVNPTMIIDSLEKFKPELFHLPPFE